MGKFRDPYSMHERYISVLSTIAASGFTIPGAWRRLKRVPGEYELVGFADGSNAIYDRLDGLLVPAALFDAVLNEVFLVGRLYSDNIFSRRLAELNVLCHPMTERELRDLVSKKEFMDAFRGRGSSTAPGDNPNSA